MSCHDLHLRSFLRKAGHDHAPALRRIDALAELLGANAILVEIAVLEVDDGSIRTLRGECHFHFGDELGIEAPVDAKLPGKYEALRRVVGDDVAGVGLAAVLVRGVPTAARLR